MKAKLAIIQFPGSNCEYETQRAARAAGFDADIVRWTIDADSFHAYDAYILPGGFSYQDRVRAGVISSRLPVVSELIKAAENGKLILGICNGCQILSEAGLLPDTAASHQVEVALAANTKDGRPHGFVCDWVYVTVKNADNSPFASAFKEGQVLPIPVNHGEGRFVFADSILEKVSAHTQFQYCDIEGTVSDKVTPNGSTSQLAGLCNKNGNVLAIMPHPERAYMSRQVPLWQPSVWRDQKRKAFTNRQEESDGPWMMLFKAMHDAVSAQKTVLEGQVS